MGSRNFYGIEKYCSVEKFWLVKVGYLLFHFLAHFLAIASPAGLKKFYRSGFLKKSFFGLLGGIFGPKSEKSRFSLGSLRNICFFSGFPKKNQMVLKDASKKSRFFLGIPKKFLFLLSDPLETRASS